MGFGKVAVQIALDEPRRSRSGPNDPINGAVVLTYNNKPGWRDITELFGPLTVKVLFSGQAVTRILNKSTQVRQINEGRLSLFQQTRAIHDGKCTLEAGVRKTFAFELKFPERSDGAQWTSNAIFDTQRILPPSFETSYSGFLTRFEALAEYRLSVEVEFPGIDVEVYNAVDFVPISYTPPPISPHQLKHRNIVLKDHFRIQNRKLLSEEHRPNGILQKAKVILNPGSSCPIWQADVKITIPQHVYLEQGISLDVALRPNIENYTGTSPELYLDHAAITVSATTFVRAKGPREDFLAEGTETVLNYTVRSMKPFSKRTDYSKQILTAPLRGFPETFSTYNITRTYSMTVEIILLGAGETMTVQRTLPIYVHSRVLGGLGSAAVAGPSSSSATAYEDAPLPDHKAPPTYEDTIATLGETSSEAAGAVKR